MNESQHAVDARYQVVTNRQIIADHKTRQEAEEIASNFGGEVSPMPGEYCLSDLKLMPLTIIVGAFERLISHTAVALLRNYDSSLVRSVGTCDYWKTSEGIPVTVHNVPLEANPPEIEEILLNSVGSKYLVMAIPSNIALKAVTPQVLSEYVDTHVYEYTDHVTGLYSLQTYNCTEGE